MKLNVRALGISLGLLWGGSLVIMGIAAMIWPLYAADFVRAVGSIYIGYKPTILGSIVGGFWGFVDAGIGGVILAWLYNRIAK